MGGNFKTGVKSSRAAETRCGCCVCIDSAGLDNTAAVKPLASNRHSGQHTEDLHKQAAAKKESMCGSFASNKQHWQDKSPSK